MVLQEIDKRSRLQLRHPIALPGVAHKIEMGVHFTVALVANKHDGQETPSQRFEMVVQKHEVKCCLA